MSELQCFFVKLPSHQVVAVDATKHDGHWTIDECSIDGQIIDVSDLWIVTHGGMKLLADVWEDQINE